LSVALLTVATSDGKIPPSRWHLYLKGSYLVSSRYFWKLSWKNKDTRYCFS